MKTFSTLHIYICLGLILVGCSSGLQGTSALSSQSDPGFSNPAPFIPDPGTPVNPVQGGINLLSSSVTPGCTIPTGQTTCPITISWNVLNGPQVGLRVILPGATATQQICLTGSPCTLNYGVGSYHFQIMTVGSDATSTVLAARDVVIQQTSTTNTTDTTPKMLSADITDGCSIPSGQTTCRIHIAWNVVNAPKAGVRYRLINASSTIQICLTGSPCDIDAQAGDYEATLFVDGTVQMAFL